MDKCACTGLIIKGGILKPTCRKEVAFEDGKVLLSRLGDQIHATSAFCTHYGAPLAKGVLTADGRVVWYAHLIHLRHAF